MDMHGFTLVYIYIYIYIVCIYVVIHILVKELLNNGNEDTIQMGFAQSAALRKLLAAEGY